MPKVKPSSSLRLRAYINEFGEDVFSTDGKILFCKICSVKVASEKKFTITQHLSRDKHVKGLEMNKAKNSKYTTQAFFTDTLTNSFNKDLCFAMLSSNIPLAKLKQSNFRNFLEKYMNRQIPEESTIRKNYVSTCYDETIASIRAYVENKKIWVSIDETTDVEGRYVANVIVGTLENNCPGKTFLLDSAVLEKANFSTISKLFDNSMSILWPTGIKHDSVLLFLSDAAPYMVKAAKSISALYSKMIHVTCIAHGLHRIAEEIRNNFPEIDTLISNVKKIFLKAPSRVLLFKSIAPEISMPPEPILTRWGTWLSAANYYCEHFHVIKAVVNELNKNDSTAIKKSQELLAKQELEASLAFVKTNYGSLPTCITRLEKSGLSLIDAISIVDEAEVFINRNNSGQGKEIQKKLEAVLKKNNGFKAIKNIKNILEGKTVSRDEDTVPEDFTFDDMTYMKFAPITSVDVERSFSIYKQILADNRRTLTFEHIKQYIVVQCNHHILSQGKILK